MGGCSFVFVCAAGCRQREEYSRYQFIPAPPHTHPQVKGFNVRSWMQANKKKIPAMLESLAKLVNADKLRAAYTE